MTSSVLIPPFAINRLKEDGNRNAMAFPMIGTYKDWKYRVRSKREDGKVVRYSIAFYRKHEVGWYDEIRHDSHEITGGRRTVAPHFHLKLRCGFKDSPDGAIEEIKHIIDNHLDALRKAIE
jgi:hypothetical protein